MSVSEWCPFPCRLQSAAISLGLLLSQTTGLDISYPPSYHLANSRVLHTLDVCALVFVCVSEGKGYSSKFSACICEIMYLQITFYHCKLLESEGILLSNCSMGLRVTLLFSLYILLLCPSTEVSSFLCCSNQNDYPCFNISQCLSWDLSNCYHNGFHHYMSHRQTQRKKMLSSQTLFTLSTCNYLNITLNKTQLWPGWNGVKNTVHLIASLGSGDPSTLGCTKRLSMLIDNSYTGW